MIKAGQDAKFDARCQEFVAALKSAATTPIDVYSDRGTEKGRIFSACTYRAAVFAEVEKIVNKLADKFGPFVLLQVQAQSTCVFFTIELEHV